MNDIDTFLGSIAHTDMRLSVPASSKAPNRAPEAMDALFHLPLLALVVMIVGRRNPFRTVFLGRHVATLLVEHFTALRHALQTLETSITLRRRCADALAFLEAARLVAISKDQQRITSLTEEGKHHLDRAARDGTDLGLLVRQLRISQERVIARSGE
ncbi:MAG: hypothetical protein ACYCS1_11870 [Gammaproteobacteria bacterium]